MVALETDDGPRGAAAEALGRLALSKYGGGSAVAAELDLASVAQSLVAGLRVEVTKPGSRSREHFARAVGRLERFVTDLGQAVPSLILCLADKHKSTRTAAAEALACISRSDDRSLIRSIVDAYKVAADPSKTDKHTGNPVTGDARRSDNVEMPSNFAPVTDQCTAFASAIQQTVERFPVLAPAVAPLAEWVRDRKKSSSSSCRVTVLKLFGNIGVHDPTTVMPMFVDCMKDTSSQVRQRACQAAGDVARDIRKQGEAPEGIMKDVVKALAAVASDEKETSEDDQVRPAAVSALGGFGPDAVSIVPQLLKMFRDKNKPLRANMFASVGELAKHLSAPVLATVVTEATKRLKDRRSEVRKAACKALGQCGQSAASAIPSIIEFTQDRGCTDTRIGAAAALGTLHRYAKDTGVPVLLRLLTDKEDEVRRMATISLGSYAAAAASEDAFIRRIIDGTRDDSERVRRAVAVTIGKIGHHNENTPSILANVLKNITDELRVQVREATIDCIAALGEHGASQVPMLTECLKDPSEAVRMATMKALARLCKDISGNIETVAARTISFLTESLMDTSKTVRITSCETIRDICSVTFPTISLLSCLKDESERVRTTAVEALVKIGQRTVSSAPVVGNKLRGPPNKRSSSVDESTKAKGGKAKQSARKSSKGSSIRGVHKVPRDASMGDSDTEQPGRTRRLSTDNVVDDSEEATKRRHDSEETASDSGRSARSDEQEQEQEQGSFWQFPQFW
eukprot:TRINITY_DN23019_c0_g1_i1.p1 TRINITY_DN23019_c0_g1~~TRINITY_DN23019_c0_g1_i1.p1  ORF type:complete len:778 (-),score=158.68 TRINITY_DN23019_c0_g1_i1:65-2290(-)